MSELFKIKEMKYNLHRKNTLGSNVHTRRYGIDSISYLGPKIWDIVPAEIKKNFNSQLLSASYYSMGSCQVSVYALYDLHSSSGLRTYFMICDVM